MIVKIRPVRPDAPFAEEKNMTCRHKQTENKRALMRAAGLIQLMSYTTTETTAMTQIQITSHDQPETMKKQQTPAPSVERTQFLIRH